MKRWFLLLAAILIFAGLAMTGCSSIDKAERAIEQASPIVEDVSKRYESLKQTTEKVQAIVDDVDRKWEAWNLSVSHAQKMVEDAYSRYPRVIDGVSRGLSLITDMEGKFADVKETLRRADTIVQDAISRYAGLVKTMESIQRIVEMWAPRLDALSAKVDKFEAAWTERMTSIAALENELRAKGVGGIDERKASEVLTNVIKDQSLWPLLWKPEFWIMLICMALGIPLGAKGVSKGVSVLKNRNGNGNGGKP